MTDYTETVRNAKISSTTKVCMGVCVCEKSGLKLKDPPILLGEEVMFASCHNTPAACFDEQLFFPPFLLCCCVSCFICFLTSIYLQIKEEQQEKQRPPEYIMKACHSQQSIEKKPNLNAHSH